MAKHVVYISDSDIPVSKAFGLASFNAGVAFTGTQISTGAVSFSQAIKKQLDIHCVHSGLANTAQSINLIANKAINLSHLKLDTSTYDAVPQTLKKMSDMLDSEGKIYQTVVDLI
jgi:threonine dehydrogenase-like Zn-dependent dehydrogenase